MHDDRADYAPRAGVAGEAHRPSMRTLLGEWKCLPARIPAAHQNQHEVPPRMLAMSAPEPGLGSAGKRIAGAGALTEEGALPRAVRADQKRAGALLDFHAQVLEHKRLPRLPPSHNPTSHRTRLAPSLPHLSDAALLHTGG